MRLFYFFFFFLITWNCFGQNIVYSDSFYQGQTYCPGDSPYDGWVSFRDSINLVHSYDTIMIWGSLQPNPRVCSDPAMATQIAHFLNQGIDTSVTCQGVIWNVGADCVTGCGLAGDDVELNASDTAADCQCGGDYTLRPCIGNANWGSIDTGGCNAPTQTMNVQLTQPPLDGGILGFTQPTTPVCVAPDTLVEVVLRNYGSDTLTTVTLDWSVNGIPQSSLSWNGILLSGQTDTILLGNYPLSTSDTLRSWTTMPNGAPDPITFNDTSVMILSQYPSFALDAGSNTNVCPLDSAQLGGNPTGPSGATYVWSNSQFINNDTIANPKAFPTYSNMTYYVTVTDTNNCQSVDSIVIISDTSRVITGMVSKSNGQAVQGSVVYLIKHFPIPDSVIALATDTTDSLGNYSFNTIEPTVYIKATGAPGIGGGMNTYYFSSTLFTGAQSISIPICDTGIRNISLIPGINNGQAFIAGYVYLGAGKKAGVGDPIANLDLLISNANGDWVANATTDSLGYFKFDLLIDDTYAIWVDKPGINNALAPEIEVASTIKTDSLVFFLQPDRLELVAPVSSSIDVLRNTSLRIYPNPYKGNTAIKFGLNEDATVKLDVISLLGEVVATLNNSQLTKGNYQYQFSADDLGYPTGVYIVRLSVNDHTSIQRIIEL